MTRKTTKIWFDEQNDSATFFIKDVKKENYNLYKEGMLNPTVGDNHPEKDKSKIHSFIQWWCPRKMKGSRQILVTCRVFWNKLKYDKYMAFWNMIINLLVRTHK